MKNQKIKKKANLEYLISVYYIISKIIFPYYKLKNKAVQKVALLVKALN